MVNLLPWRERKRRQSRRRFLLALACSLLVVIVVLLLLYRGIEMRIAAGIVENRHLRAEISRLGARAADADRLRREQAQTLLRMQVLNSLQRSRPLAAEILAELARKLPDAVTFRQLARSGGEVRIEGESRSHAAIAELMRKLAASPLFADAELAGVAGAGIGQDSAAASGSFAFSLVLSLTEDRS